MTTEEAKIIEGALHSSKPLETLREYALELSKNGAPRKIIYTLFKEMFDKLEEEGREVEQGYIELILDSITQFMSPTNPLYMDLPK